VIETKKFILSKKMEEPSFTLLMMIVEKWLTTGKGSTVTELTKRLNPKSRGSEMHNTRLKFTLLHSRGMIEIIGKGFSACNIYAPTASTLVELNSMQCETKLKVSA